MDNFCEYVASLALVPLATMYYCFSDEPISVCSVRVSMEHDSSLFRELASLPASVRVQLITLTPRQPCVTVKSTSTGSRHLVNTLTQDQAYKKYEGHLHH